MKKKKISKSWLIKHKKDSFFKQSRIQGYRSRSAFKLIEMNKKFKFLKKNLSILDLGASPGGWSQVANKEAVNSKILAVDIIPMKKINNVNFLKGDFRNADVNEEIMIYFKNKIDVVMSDMAANTSGNKNLDAFRTGELCLESMHLSIKILNQNGIFLSKMFMGSTFKEIKEKAMKNFKKVVIYKPMSSKQESKEIYIYCKGILKI